jgi:hypothetical protein
LIVATAHPLDGKPKAVFVNGRPAKFDVVRAGDVQRVQVTIEDPQPKVEVRFEYIGGTDVYNALEPLKAGALSEGLRVIRSQADQNTLHLTLEGIGGREYSLPVWTSRRLGETSGVRLNNSAGSGQQQLLVSFDGAPGAYIRRELAIPLSDNLPTRTSAPEAK